MISIDLICSLLASSAPGLFCGGGEERKERLQLRLWNLNSTSNSPVAPCRMSCQIIPSCGHTTDFLPRLKLDLLAVYLGKLLSVTDFSLGNLPRGNLILSSGAWICLENNRVSLDSYLKAIAREK